MEASLLSEMVSNLSCLSAPRLRVLFQLFAGDSVELFDLTIWTQIILNVKGGGHTAANPGVTVTDPPVTVTVSGSNVIVTDLNCHGNRSTRHHQYKLSHKITMQQ